MGISVGQQEGIRAQR